MFTAPVVDVGIKQGGGDANIGFSTLFRVRRRNIMHGALIMTIKELVREEKEKSEEREGDPFLTRAKGLHIFSYDIKMSCIMFS